MRGGLLILVVLTASCNRQDMNLCQEPPAADAGGANGCIHRTSYQYAHSSGTNSELARAVVTQCSFFIQNELPSRASSDLYEVMLKSAEQTALNRIIQAKAGNCDRPK